VDTQGDFTPTRLLRLMAASMGVDHASTPKTDHPAPAGISKRPEMIRG
jgi:hypothetical protein